MNRSWFWFGLAAGFALLIFWKKKQGNCGCSTSLSGGSSTTGLSAFGADGASGGAGGAGGIGGTSSRGCACAGYEPAIVSPIRPISGKTTVRSPGGWSEAPPNGGSRPGVGQGTSIFAQENVNYQLTGSYK